MPYISLTQELRHHRETTYIITGTGGGCQCKDTRIPDHVKVTKDEITHLPDQKGDDDGWTVRLLTNKLHKYIINQENVDRHCSSKDDSTHSVGHMWSTSQVSEATTTTEALFSGPNRLKHLNVRKREVCIDCNAKYWSDEGSKYPTVTARRKKIKGNCFICLKQGHHQRDFKTK